MLGWQIITKILILTKVDKAERDPKLCWPEDPSC